MLTGEVAGTVVEPAPGGVVDGEFEVGARPGPGGENDAAAVLRPASQALSENRVELAGADSLVGAAPAVEAVGVRAVRVDDNEVDPVEQGGHDGAQVRAGVGNQHQLFGWNTEIEPG